MSDVKSFISFESYQVLEMEFVLNPAFVPDKNNIQLEPTFSVSHHYFTDPVNGVEVTLGCELFDKDFSNTDKPFYLNLILKGLFTIETENKEQISLDIVKDVSFANTVAILFPYLRSSITSITATANVDPLILPTININNLLRNS